MRRRAQAVAAILAALPALILACAGWLQADAKSKEARKAYDSYGEYVTDQLHRDEALLRALRECETMLHLRPSLWVAYSMEGAAAGAALGHSRPEGAQVGVVVPAPIPTPEPQAQAVLDEIARREGWAPNGGTQ